MADRGGRPGQQKFERQRAANVMTLIQSAKINGRDPQAYLRNVLERLR